MPDNNKKDVLLYSDSHFDKRENKFILQATVNYIKSFERFSESIFQKCFYYHGKFLPIYHV